MLLINNRKKRVKSKYLNIMVIPERSNEKTRDCRMPVILLKISVIAVILLTVAEVALIRDYTQLRFLRGVNEELTHANEAQAVQIDGLISLSKDLQEKMSQVLTLDVEVRERISLIGDKIAETEGLTLLSESSQASPLPVRALGYSDALPYGTDDDDELWEEDEQLNVLEELKQELESMDLLMNDQVQSLNVLKTDVDKEIAYEATLPNQWPMVGRITSPFGYRNNPTGRGIKFHDGLDIANSRGTSITAAGDGVVSFVGYRSGWGNMVLISHGNGYVSQYAHCQKTLVSAGDKVTKGQKIATCGSTGSSTGVHLHFGISKNGKWVDPQTVLK